MIKSAMQTHLDLPKKYADMGFELSKPGGKSIALRFQGNLIILFSGIDASEGFVSRLCDCHLKTASNEKIINFV
jgi:hypothetical protein